MERSLKVCRSLGQPNTLLVCLTLIRDACSCLVAKQRSYLVHLRTSQLIRWAFCDFSHSNKSYTFGPNYGPAAAAAGCMFNWLLPSGLSVRITREQHVCKTSRRGVGLKWQMNVDSHNNVATSSERIGHFRLQQQQHSEHDSGANQTPQLRASREALYIRGSICARSQRRRRRQKLLRILIETRAYCRPSRRYAFVIARVGIDLCFTYRIHYTSLRWD